MRDAIAVLSPALRGKLDASNFYVTHTELHELLGQAWEAAGVRDSAVVHYTLVARAWSAGDPPYRARADNARARAAALKSGYARARERFTANRQRLGYLDPVSADSLAALSDAAWRCRAAACMNAAICGHIS